MCYLSTHGGQVPDAADDGPAAHHVQEIADHPKLTAVPEGIPKARIILHRGGMERERGRERERERERKHWREGERERGKKCKGDGDSKRVKR